MYATTREFLERFGLNDLTDLPKVEEMSDVLGFDLPSALREPTVTTNVLPFERPSDEAGTEGAGPEEAAGEEPAGEPGGEAEPAVIGSRDDTVH
jgi:hypothetical protein